MFNGYHYQDLLTALLAVDVLLGTTSRLHVETSWQPADLFDDVTTYHISGVVRRIQLKHFENLIPFPSQSLTSDRRGMRLDKIVQSILESRSSYEGDPNDLEFRIITDSLDPEDGRLLSFLRPEVDLESLIPKGSTTLYRLDIERLSQSDPGSVEELVLPRRRRGQDLRDVIARAGISDDDLKWVGERLVLEVGFPRMSHDLRNPGAAELVLLNQLEESVGAGLPPNQHRSPTDVAALLIYAAEAARSQGGELTRDWLLEVTGLRSDLGAVHEPTMVEPHSEVIRSETLSELAEVVAECAMQSRPLIVHAGPGQGKSWLSERFVDEARDRGWHVAYHVCYVSADDSLLEVRVTPETVIGSLQASFQKFRGSSDNDQPPIFAANVEGLNKLLASARDTMPDKRILLVVDGLDHVQRVVSASRELAHRDSEVVNHLSQIELPPNASLLVFSQRIHELRVLEDIGAELWELPPLSLEETTEYVGKQGLIDPVPIPYGAVPIAHAIHQKARGNALYTRYLSSELQTKSKDPSEWSTLLSLIQDSSGTIADYYEYISAGTNSAQIVAQYLSVLEFGISSQELKDLAPTVQNTVESALSALKPVLRFDSNHERFRYHHESFARFYGAQMLTEQIKAINREKAAWLGSLGFLHDDRANRYLVRSLGQSENLEGIKDLEILRC